MDVVQDGQEVWHEGKGRIGAGIEAEPNRQPATDGTEADGDNSVRGFLPGRAVTAEQSRRQGSNSSS